MNRLEDKIVLDGTVPVQTQPFNLDEWLVQVSTNAEAAPTGPNPGIAPALVVGGPGFFTITPITTHPDNPVPPLTEGELHQLLQTVLARLRTLKTEIAGLEKDNRDLDDAIARNMANFNTALAAGNPALAQAFLNLIKNAKDIQAQNRETIELKSRAYSQLIQLGIDLVRFLGGTAFEFDPANDTILVRALKEIKTHLPDFGNDYQ